MGSLSIYLTPFAADYSGVCSALFDLNCMCAINDASCCTSHYVYYDEPRWSEKVRPIFSTAIRNMDAILGNDEKIINVICDASKELESDMIAVVGTPVPALTGMDMEGIAAEIEYRTGKPSFGFQTTGFDYYDKGIYMAGKALIDRLAKPTDRVPFRVNILGTTPLDIGNCKNEELIEKILKDNGFNIGARFFMGLDTGQIENCASAEINIAVTSAGLSLAKYLNKLFKTPYYTGFPMGKEHSEKWLKGLKDLREHIYGESKADISAADENSEIGIPYVEEEGQRVLIVGDQVLSNSIRQALEIRMNEGKQTRRSIDVATFFGFSKDIARKGDMHFNEESDYLDVLASKKYVKLIADPQIIDVPQIYGMITHQLVHPAVSSFISWKDAKYFSGPEFEAWLI